MSVPSSLTRGTLLTELNALEVTVILSLDLNFNSARVLPLRVSFIGVPVLKRFNFIDCV